MENKDQQILQLKASLFDMQQELSLTTASFQNFVNVVVDSLNLTEAKSLEEVISSVQAMKVEDKES